MFYLLHKKQMLPLYPNLIYAFCPSCGALHKVDLKDVFPDGNVDLSGTAVYCTKCSKAIQGKPYSYQKKSEKCSG